GMAADDENLYVCLESRVSSFYVPGSRAAKLLAAQESAKDEGPKEERPKAEGMKEEGPRTGADTLLRPAWGKLYAPQYFAQPPMITPDLLALLATDGTL